MAGVRLDNVSPSSSDDESGVGSGGAPLYAWSPETRTSPGEEIIGLGLQLGSASTRSDEASSSKLSAGSSFDPESNLRTSPDQDTLTLNPVEQHQSSLSNDLTKQTITTSSAGAITPSLSLSAYPGPGVVSQRLSSLSVYAPASSSAFQTDGRSSIPGSTTHSFITAMKAMSLHAAEDNIHPAQKTHREQTCKFQARVWGLRQGMYRQNLIPRNFLLSFDYDVQELMNNAVKMNQAADQLAAELKKALAKQESNGNLEATVLRLEADVRDWKERALNAERTLAGIARRTDEDMKTIQFLKEQLRQNEMARNILQEQVNGKRNLWLNVHNAPEDRAAALDTLARSSTPFSGQTLALTTDHHAYGPSLRGPAGIRSSSAHTAHVAHSGLDRSGTPVPSGNANNAGFCFGDNGQQQLAGPLARGYSPFQALLPSYPLPAAYQGPQPHHQRCLSTTTTGASGRSSAGYASRPPSGPRRNARVPPAVTETGSPKERKRKDVTHSLVREIDLEDAGYIKWADEFQSLFALVYGFCDSYFHELPVMDDDWKKQIRSEAGGQLWKYMRGICQSNQGLEPGEHAMRLLKDRDSRPYLMQRLILQHILLFICSYEGWKDYSEDNDEEMEKLEEQLKKIDPSKTHDRQQIIDRRTQLVAEMSSGQNAAAFRNYKLTQHHQYLKTMVAPFLARRRSPNITNEAFYDLFTVTTAAWDLSGNLFGSRLTFAHAWAEPGARFSADAHEPLDCRVDRRTLEHEHCRVRFCATPAVTVRSDRGMTIDAKNILKAGVLVMNY